MTRRQKELARANDGFSVKALRTLLGASRETLAAMLGVRTRVVAEWETGKRVSRGGLRVLRELAARAEMGTAALPEAPSPPPEVATGAGTQAPSVPEPQPLRPITYANRVLVRSTDRESLLSFCLDLPGGERRYVLNVIVPLSVLETIRHSARRTTTVAATHRDLSRAPGTRG